MTPWELQTRKYLDSVRIRDRLVADLQEEKDRLEQAIYSVRTPGMDEKVRASPVADRTINQLMALEKKREELAAAYNAYMDFRIKVVKEIHKIPNENQKMVIYQHYLQFQPFRTISENRYFNYAYVTRLHMDGIRAFWRTNKEVVEKYSKK